MRRVFILLAWLAYAAPAFAWTHGTPSGGLAPVADLGPEIDGLDYPNNGSSTALSGTTTTLSVNNLDSSRWLNSPLSFTCNWHTTNAPLTSLGANCAALTLTASTYAGQTIEVDVTAANLSGSTTATSHWFGPIETTVPVALTTWECTNAPVNSGVCMGNVGQTYLSQAYGNWLQNGHAIFWGGHIPPVAPANTATTGNPSHVWYFDPINGTTQAAGATGHLGSAFKDIAALCNTTTGYASSPLFKAAAGPIVAGDTIYLEPNVNPSLISYSCNSMYSTTTGNDGDPIVDTWVMTDPASSALAVMKNIVIIGGSGFIYKNIALETRREIRPLDVSGNASSPIHDMQFEGFSIAGSIGHANDSWLSTHYPSSGGTSDGTVVTASPGICGISSICPQDPSLLFPCPSGCSAGTTTFAGTPIGFNYVWSYNYIRPNNATSTPSSGIPNGTIVKLVSGLTKAQFNGASTVTPTTVGSIVASTFTANTLAGTRATQQILPNDNNHSTYWLTATSPTVIQGVYTWNDNNVSIWFTDNPSAGNTLIADGTTFTYVASGATGTQINIGANIAATVSNTITVLHASANMNLSASTYTNFSTAFSITYGTAGQNLQFDVSSIAGASANSYISIGTIPPAAPTVSQVLKAVDTGHFIWWNGSAWQDQGAPSYTLAPCDPTNDAATGCPTTAYGDLTGSGSNVPGCDPIWSSMLNSALVINGSCATTGTPAWNGATRTIASTEEWTFTNNLVITAAGSWSVSDWSGISFAQCGQTNGCGVSSADFTGVNDGSHSQDPTQPNYYRYATFMSLKDSMVRWAQAGIVTQSTANMVMYHNRVKLFSVDGFEIYGNNRNWVFNNWCSDPTEIFGHQDCEQHGTTNTNAAREYNDSDVGNEFYQITDPTNYFPMSMQGDNFTEGISVGGYYANNNIFATTNGMAIDGPLNVVVQNTVIGKAVGIGNQPKGEPFEPLNDLFANNIGNGVSRYIGQGGGSTFCTTDGTTIATNLSIPQIPVNAGLGGNSNIYCTLGSNSPTSGTAAGAYVGMLSWNIGQAWNSNNSPISPLFTAYNPLANPVAPNPGFGFLWFPFLNPCPQNSFPAVGACSPGADGIINSRPNASFTGTSAADVAAIIAAGHQAAGPNNLPTSGTIGDKWIIQGTTFCPNGSTICGGGSGQFVNVTFPAGVYTRASASTTMAGYGSSMGFALTGTGFGVTQGSGSVTVGGVVATISSWSATAISGTLGATSPALTFTITGTGYAVPTGSVAINGVGASVTLWNNTTITGIMPAGAAFPTSGNTVITLASGATGTFGTATMNVAVTPNGGGSGTIATAGETGLSSGSLPFNPGIKNLGTDLTAGALAICGASSNASCAPYADLLGKAWNSTPSIGPVE